MADGSLPNILQEVDIEMISDEICHTTKNTEMLTVSVQTTPSDWLPVITPSDWRRMSFRSFRIRDRCEREKDKILYHNTFLGLHFLDLHLYTVKIT